MTDLQFNTMMRSAFAWLASSTAVALALLSLSFGVGWLEVKSSTGPALGLLAALAVAQLACWTRFRRLVAEDHS